MPATEGTWRAAWLRFRARGNRSEPLIVALALSGFALGTFLAARRASGALTSPVPPTVLVATAVALVGWAISIRLLCRRRHPAAERTLAGPLRSPEISVSRWLPVLTILLFAYACSYPGHRAIDWIAWSSAMGAVVLLRDVPWPARRSSPATVRDATSDELVLQQLNRVRTAEGKDAMRGSVVAEFSPGQRDAAVYVAFCPPFEKLPDVEAFVIEDSLATVKVAQRLHNGVQLDVRIMDAAEEPFALRVEFFAAEPD